MLIFLPGGFFHSHTPTNSEPRKEGCLALDFSMPA